MFVLCKYFAGTTRLIAGMRNFSSLKNFHFHTLTGILVWNKGAFKLVTPEATVLMMGNSPSTGKNIMAIITNEAQYEKFDGKPIDLANIHCEVPLFSLCNMLREKYEMTGNRFELEVQGDSRVAKVSMDEDMHGRFKCIVRTSSGDCIVTGDDNLRKILKDCTVINAFHYCTNSPDVEKEVSIRRGYGEILKEISRYLNRTVMLTSTRDGKDGGMSDTCVSTHGILEVHYRSDGGVSCRRVAPADVKYTKMLCVSFTTQSIDDLSRSRQS